MLRLSLPAGLMILVLVGACSGDNLPTATSSVTTATEPTAVECGSSFTTQLTPATEVQALTDTKGMTASRAYPGILWVIGVAAGQHRLIAFDDAGNQGSSVILDRNLISDLLDISIGPGPDPARNYIYIAERGAEGHLRVLRFGEPDPVAASQLGPVELFEFEYSDQRRRAEALFLDPQNGDLYVVTDDRRGAVLYRASAPLDPARTVVLQPAARIGSTSTRTPVLSADVTGDGRTLAIRSTSSLLLWSRDASESIPEAVVSAPCSGLLAHSADAGALAVRADGAGFIVLKNGQLRTYGLPQVVGAPQEGLMGNLASDLRVVEPAGDFLWRSGSVLRLGAEVRDDGPTEERGFAWSATAVSCPELDSCSRRLLHTGEGSAVEDFLLPTDLAMPVYIEINAKYTDRGGLTSVDTLELFPQTVAILVDSDPPGAQVSIGEATVTTPHAVDVLAGTKVRVEVPPAQEVGNRIYGFARWSDGGERAHQVDGAEGLAALVVELAPRQVFATGFSGDDSVRIGDIDGLDGDMSWEMWLRPSDFSVWRNPMSKAISGEGAITQVDRSLVFLQGEGGGNTEGWENFGFGAELAAGNWTHVVLTRSGRLVSWYLDGVRIARKTFDKIASDSDLPLIIGNGYANGYAGEIDEVAVYRRALTGREVTDHFNAIGDPTRYRRIVVGDEPVGYWRLNEVSGSTAQDEMGNWPGEYRGNPRLGEEGAS